MRLAFRPRGKIASLGVVMLVALASAMTLSFCSSNLKIKLGWSTRWMRGRDSCERWRRLQDAETGERGFLLTNDESFLEPYEGAIRAINEQFDELGKAVSDIPNRSRGFRNCAISNVGASRRCVKISSAVGG